MLNKFVDWPEDLKQRYKQQGLYSGELLGEILSEHIKQQPEKIAIIDQRQSITYAQLEKRANQLVRGFEKKSLLQGDTVILQSSNQIAFFEVLIALFKMQVKPVLALPAHRLFEVEAFCEIADAKMYIALDDQNSAHQNSQINEQYAQIGLSIKEKYKARKKEFSICLQKPSALSQDILVLDELYQDGNQENDKPTNKAIQAEEIALFQLSGGTTGMPKLIARTHNDYHYSVRASNEICAITDVSVYLAILPVMHNFSLSSPGALGVLYAGGTLILNTANIASLAFELIQTHKVTICALVPPILLNWIQAYKQAPNQFDLSSLEVLQVGGAKLNHSVAQKVTPVLGCQLQQVFGMAEGLVNYTRLLDSQEIILNTQGRPISDADDILVVDENDEPVDFGVAGHLLTRGPYTIRGYYNNPEHNKHAFTKDGFYRTGDIVIQNKQGYLTVEDRSKDQINRGGEKISAEEIENHLMQHELVFDASVVAMPDEFLGERSCAFIILNKNDDQQSDFVIKKSLLKYMKKLHIADFKVPDRFEFLDAFPKTKFGKVNKVILREVINNKLNLA